MATVEYERNDDGELVRVVTGNNGNEELNGRSKYPDVIFGNGGDDILHGEGRADELYGGDDNDVLDGGDDDDYLDGGRGDDRGYGGDGFDAFYGRDGNDRFGGNEGDDYARMGRGDDVAYGDEGFDYLRGDQDNDRMYGGDDDDYLRGDDGDDRLLGDDGDDYLEGGKGTDRLVGGEGNDLLDGGEGDDLLTADSDDVLQYVYVGTDDDRPLSVGDDAVQGGLPAQLDIQMFATLADGRDGLVDVASFLDSNGSGAVTGADIWVRSDDEGNLVLDLGGIIEETTGERPDEIQSITLTGQEAGFKAALVTSLLDGTEFRVPVAYWTGSEVLIREPDI